MLKTIGIILLSISLLSIAALGGLWYWANHLTDIPVYQTPRGPVIGSSTPVSSVPSSSISIVTSTKPAPVVTKPTEPVTTPVKPPVSTSTPPTTSNKKIILVSGVPFTSQAPNGHWSDPLQENGCEEAATMMAVYWARGLKLNKTLAEQEIIAMGNYQIKKYGEAVDTNAADTVSRLFIGYYDYDQVRVKTSLTKDDIIKTLSSDQLVLIPTNGRLLKNPNYTAPGPSTHMLVILGYDPNTDQFITNDSGTRNGEHYRYSAALLLSAVVDYPTGDHEKQDPSKKAYIIVSR